MRVGPPTRSKPTRVNCGVAQPGRWDRCRDGAVPARTSNRRNPLQRWANWHSTARTGTAEGRVQVPPSDKHQWEMSRSHSRGVNPRPVEREFRVGRLVGDLTHRPQSRVLRNLVGFDEPGEPSASPLRRNAFNLFGTSEGRDTFRAMKQLTTDMGGVAPSGLRRLSERPGHRTRAVAKAISRTQPEVPSTSPCTPGTSDR